MLYGAGYMYDAWFAGGLLMYEVTFGVRNHRAIKFMMDEPG